MVEARTSAVERRRAAAAQIDDIARAVGVNRAIIYRHLTGKEELFALTLVGYLDELHERLRAADAPHDPPVRRLQRITESFVDYGVQFPAFVDCAQTLMRPAVALPARPRRGPARRRAHPPAPPLPGRRDRARRRHGHRYRRVRASEPLALAVRAEALRPHPRGHAFDLVTEVQADDGPVWEERSTMLRPGAG